MDWGERGWDGLYKWNVKRNRSGLDGGDGF